MISALLAIGKMWLSHHQENKKAEAEQYRAEVAAGLHDPNKLRGLKWATFLQFSAPIWLGFYDPDLLARVLASLNTLPQWYVEAYLMIVGGVWASAVGKDVLESVFKTYRRSKKDK